MMIYFNGNISAITWTYGNQINGYMYYYDNYNRLNLCYSILNSTFADGLYTESMTYDKSGNIKRLTRWDHQDIMDYLHYTYDGNQVTKIVDEGWSPVDYDTKRYMDLADVAQEMDYDANGNLIYDLDRQIVAIRYNLLNLPDTVQFANGNQIINHYDASGVRYKTSYRTRKVAATVPVGETLTATDNLSDYQMTTYAMDRNIRYLAWSNNSLTLEYVFNSEGYYANLTDAYFYYIKDHLGNIRETYVYPEPNYKECVQRMQYYPSGLPWNETMYASEQPYKYNSKEFVEMHGLDEYDSEARWYYPALMRTTTIDPLAEKYPDISPYAWCGNNFINIIDPEGKDIWRLDGTNARVLEEIETDEFDRIEIETYDSQNDTKQIKSIEFEYGTIKQEQATNTDGISYDMYTIKDHESSIKLFEFLAENTYVEWSLAKVTTNQQNIGYLTSSHDNDRERGMTHLINSQLYKEHIIHAFIHSHPNGAETASGYNDKIDKVTGKVLQRAGTYGDAAFANQVCNYFFPIPILQIYVVRNPNSKLKGQYIYF